MWIRFPPPPKLLRGSQTTVDGERKSKKVSPDGIVGGSTQRGGRGNRPCGGVSCAHASIGQQQHPTNVASSCPTPRCEDSGHRKLRFRCGIAGGTESGAGQ